MTDCESVECPSPNTWPNSCSTGPDQHLTPCLDRCSGVQPDDTKKTGRQSRLCACAHDLRIQRRHRQHRQIARCRIIVDSVVHVEDAGPVRESGENGGLNLRLQPVYFDSDVEVTGRQQVPVRFASLRLRAGECGNCRSDRNEQNSESLYKSPIEAPWTSMGNSR